MRNVSKDIFLNTLVCPTRGWILRNGDIPGLTDATNLPPGDKFRIEQGIEIGRRARSLHPHGMLVTGADFDASCIQTQEYLSNPGTVTMFEGAFQTGAFRTRADILIRQGETWRVTEVKSDTNLKPELVDDLAYTVMVLTRWGLNISGASLLLISKDYRLGMDDEHLVVESDLTVEVMSRAREFESVIDHVDAVTSVIEKPEVCD